MALDSPMRKSYERIFHCGHTIIQKNHKITSKYCGDRWCRVCGSIRMARAIDGYGDQLKSLKDIQFLTLTARNVEADGLRKEIESMIKIFQRIRGAARKAKIHIKGLRKLECTHNSNDDTYNPHFHLLIEGHEAARYILDGWIERHPDALEAGQCLKEADEDAIMELLKYAFKLPFNVDNLDDKEIVAADVIFQAMRRKRTLQPFGGIKAVKEDIDAEDLDAVIETDEAIERAYVWYDHDWYCVDSGEALSGYMPAKDNEVKEDPSGKGEVQNNICKLLTYKN